MTHRLHLGIRFNNTSRIDITDCVSDKTYNLFRKISSNNTQIYDEVFKCLPTDNVLSFRDLENYTESPCLNSDNMRLVSKVNGALFSKLNINLFGKLIFLG